MAGKTLRVLARGTASVPVHGAHARGQSKFVGRFDDFDLGTPFIAIDETGMKTPSVMPARVCSAEPTVFDQDDDYNEFTEQLLHLRYGDLWPFDEATARMAGVPFDPSFGGEYAKEGKGLVNVAHRDALKAIAKTKPALVTLPAASAPNAEESK